MADHKTLEVTLRFWGNKIPKVEGMNLAWDSGAVILPSNKLFGVEKTNHLFFNSLDDIMPAIKDLLHRNKINLLSDNKRPAPRGKKDKDS